MAPKVPQPAKGEHIPRPVPSQRDRTSEFSQASAQPVKAEIVLPLSVVSRADISRSLRELQSIDNFFHQAAVRGSKDSSMPTLGKVLDGLASANNLNLIHSEDRDRLKSFLTRVKAKAPVVHMSFPSEASPAFINKILEWFRAEAHPYTVLHIGLQPELAAGCIVRTTNKSFDFSFRKRFEQSKQKLVAALEAADKAAAVPVPGTPEPAPAQAQQETVAGGGAK